MARVLTYCGGLFLVLGVLIFSGCPKKVGLSMCKSNEDCRVDATGKEVSGVCYMGKCEECAETTDCKDLKQCVNNRCLSACQADLDCGSNHRCENNFCVAINEEGGFGQNPLATGECQGFENVLFDFDRFEVKPEYKDQVAKIAKCMESNPGFSLRIDGHTDNRGTPTYNAALAQKRADAVKNHLKTTWGIAANRVKTISYGEQRPLITESNEYAWQQNRRAEFAIEQN